MCPAGASPALAVVATRYGTEPWAVVGDGVGQALGMGVQAVTRVNLLSLENSCGSRPRPLRGKALAEPALGCNMPLASRQGPVGVRRDGMYSNGDTAQPGRSRCLRCVRGAAVAGFRVRFRERQCRSQNGDSVMGNRGTRKRRIYRRNHSPWSLIGHSNEQGVNPLRANPLNLLGWGTWIRTRIKRVRAARSTVELSPIKSVYISIT